ncbi:MAG: GNAT family N-acetyltransferase [Sulfitobacter sp.]
MDRAVSDGVHIRQYRSNDAQVWNDFVGKAVNATFLHDRNFMDYHADRFQDHSLIIEDAGKIIALLPANQKDDVMHSHGGLTYGGLLVPPRYSATQMIEIIASLRDYLVASGITCLFYKPSPHIFHSQPAEADLHALVQAGAKLVQTDMGTAIPLRHRLPFNTLRKRGVKKALKAGLEVRESHDFQAFWDVLSTVLQSRHNTAPTHSLEEIILLAQRFPDKIRLFASFDAEQMLAGMILFDCGTTVHAQYIATADAGRDLGALDLLVHHLLDNVFNDRGWFSFGISTTNGGRDLNVGLSRQKEMFGGQSVMFSKYQWDLT